jgi:hypothetical protein
MSSQKLLVFALSILSALLICLNVALVVQNGRLKAIAKAPSPVIVPQVGTKFPKLDGAALDGSRLILPFGTDNRKTLLLIFSTTCRVCDQNWSAWQSVVRSIVGRPYRVVYANIHSLLTYPYVVRHNFTDGIVFAEIDPRISIELHLEVTPLSILLAPDGTVEKVWPGLLEGGDLAEVTRVLSH